MTFRTLTLADALFVAERMRDRDWECLRACTLVDSAEVFATNRWQTDGPAWTYVEDGLPAAICGIHFALPWNGVCWYVATDRPSTTALKKLLREAHTVLSNAAKAVPRLEAHVLGTWPEAARFARRLGFELESVRKRAGRDGQDVLTFVYRQGNE